MIRRLKYHEIDFEKYTNCIENSEQRKYSASRLFLDITSCRKWEVLVLGDYEVVMPVPFVKKFGVKLIINPKLCQQLGIFSKKDDATQNELFLTYLKKNYKVWYYAFNDGNSFSSPLKKRNNFLIYPDEYENVRQRYSPKRKRKLRLDADVIDVSEIRKMKIGDAYSFISKNMIGAKNENDKKEFLKIFQALGDSGALTVYAFMYQSRIINAIAVYDDEKTSVLLGTFNEREYVKLAGSSVIIDAAIRENIEKKIFDFEGSEVPAIEEFFRGFRPELKPYCVVENSKKEIIRNLFSLR